MGPAINDPSHGWDRLPQTIRDSARVESNGEVAWPITDARAAVDALAGAGCVILGLDLRRYDDGIMEVPWSDFEPDGASHEQEVQDGREAALSALRRPNLRDVGDFDWSS
jgi:hypothetical protein